jgi:hypothetical protein
MITKYAVYDPATGENTLVDSKEEAALLYWERMIELSKQYFHNTMWMTVEQNEDGSEVWKNENGEGIKRPKTFEEMEALRKIVRAKKIENPTTVEILP